MSDDALMSPRGDPGDARAEARQLLIAAARGTIANIPILGPYINEVIDTRSRLQLERIERLLHDVAGDVAQLKTDAIKIAFIRSEQFSDLLEDILTRAARTASEDKRAHFRRVLVGALQGRTDPDFAPLFLGFLSEMTEAEVLVLRQLAPYLAGAKEREALGREVEMDPFPYVGFADLREEHARQVVQALVSKGLLADDSHRRAGLKAFTVIEPSELGVRFLDWLDPAWRQGATPTATVDSAERRAS